MDPIARALSSLSASSLSSLVARNDELVRSELEALRTKFFVCLVAATIAVFAGVMLEEGEAWMHAIKRLIPLDPITIYRWAKKLVKVGWILIVIGVAGEGIFEVLVTRTDDILGTFNSVLLTEARREASNAVLGAAIANTQVAEAKQRTAELEKEAAALLVENTRLEAIVQPRNLKPKQQRELAESCGKFHGHGAEISSYGMDAEALIVSSQIIAALQAAQIVVADNRSSKIITGTVEKGIHVRTKFSSELPFASCISDALQDAGLVTKLNDPEPPFRGAGMMGGGQSFTGNPPHITILVGVKPLP